MIRPLDEYALIGDCETSALVGCSGSIDWLAFPRFDSPACFAALLGTAENGRWLLAPRGDVIHMRRWYHPDTLILETEFTTTAGVVSLIDFMPVRSGMPDLVRIVAGRRGQVAMRLELVIRFDYGSIVPWVRSTSRGISAIGGPDSLTLRSDVPLRGEDLRSVADFVVSEGQRIAFDLTWFPSHVLSQHELDVERALKETEAWWQEWSARCTVGGPWRDAVVRSLITLKALTYAPTRFSKESIDEERVARRFFEVTAARMPQILHHASSTFARCSHGGRVFGWNHERRMACQP